MLILTVQGCEENWIAATAVRLNRSIPQNVDWRRGDSWAALPPIKLLLWNAAAITSRTQTCVAGVVGVVWTGFERLRATPGLPSQSLSPVLSPVLSLSISKATDWAAIRQAGLVF